jgi:hypothetical protein
MGEVEMGWVVDEAYKVQRALGWKELILATTSRKEEEGSFNHFKWAVTSLSTVGAFLPALISAAARKFCGIADDEEITVVIQGFGDVGSGCIPVILDMFRAFGIKISGVSNTKGAIYQEGGLDERQLRRFREMALREERIVFQDVYEGECLRFGQPNELVFDPRVKATVLIPAAGPNLFKRENIPGLKGRFKIISEGANNSVVRGCENMFHELGILFIEGFIANFGGIYTSTDEFFHNMMEGKAVVHKIDEMRIHSQDGVSDLALSTMTWLLAEMANEGHSRSLSEVAREKVEKIQDLKREFLENPTSEIWRRVHIDVRRGIPEWIAYIIACSEFARETVRYEDAALASIDDSLDPMAQRIGMHDLSKNVARIEELNRQGALNREEVIGQLIAILSDTRQRPDVRRIAAEALGNFNEKRAIPVLKERWLDAQEDERVKVWARWALEKMGIFTGAPGFSYDEWHYVPDGKQSAIVRNNLSGTAVLDKFNTGKFCIAGEDKVVSSIFLFIPTLAAVQPLAILAGLAIIGILIVSLNLTLRSPRQKTRGSLARAETIRLDARSLRN